MRVLLGLLYDAREPRAVSFGKQPNVANPFPGLDPGAFPSEVGRTSQCALLNKLLTGRKGN